MEVKPGYKQTEVGIIPNDWGSSSLGECLETHPSYGINAPATPDRADLPRYLRITDISEEGRFLPNPPTSVNHNSSNKFLLKEGDITIARTGASTGKSYQYNTRDGDLVYAGFLIKISPNKSIINPIFLAGYLKTKRYWNWINQTSTRSGQPGINANQLTELDVPLPPIHEQTQIATALSNMDALLENLKSLIAKKRTIKQATMQQLLSGKTRASILQNNWIDTTLGEIVERFVGGGTPSRKIADYWGGDIPWVSTKDFASFSPHSSQEYITRQGLNNSTTSLIPAKTLLISTRMAVGKTAIYKMNVAINQDIKALILRANISQRFLLHWLNHNNHKISSTSNGSTVSGISITDLKRIKIKIPDIHEQNSIARILDDLDYDISILESRMHKTNSLKQAMMQELLTGRTRLI